MKIVQCASLRMTPSYQIKTRKVFCGWEGLLNTGLRFQRILNGVLKNYKLMGDLCFNPKTGHKNLYVRDVFFSP